MWRYKIIVLQEFKPPCSVSFLFLLKISFFTNVSLWYVSFYFNDLVVSSFVLIQNYLPIYNAYPSLQIEIKALSPEALSFIDPASLKWSRNIPPQRFPALSHKLVILLNEESGTPPSWALLFCFHEVCVFHQFSVDMPSVVGTWSRNTMLAFKGILIALCS